MPRPVHQWLPEQWLGRGWAAHCLRPVSWLYGALVQVRLWAYRQGWLAAQRVQATVIVVGNVVAGGAGKTPTTIALVQHLLQRGWRVGVVSRGHGRQTTDVRPVLAQSKPSQVGDEPLLIAQATGVPVWVGASRAQAAQALLQAHPGTRIIVCDDGLQHLALARDIEICVMDERGVGNGHMLPAGPLREAWPRQALNPNVPCLVLKTGGEAGPNEYAVQRHLADYALQADGTKRSLSDWWDTPVQALAGIAKPEVFFAMLRERRLNVVHTQALPDHADLQALHIDASQGDVLCTEKDAVKLWAHHPHAWAVPLHTTLPAELLAAIDLHLTAAQNAKLSSPHGHQTA